MEKRLILAIGLSVLVLVGWNYIFPPPERPQVTPPVDLPDLSAPVEPGAASGATDPTFVPPGDDAPPAEAAQAERDEEIVFSNDLFTVVFTNRGARSTSWSLEQYRTDDGNALELWQPFQERDAYPLALETNNPTLTAALNDALFLTTRTPVSAANGRAAGERIEFKWSDGRGIEARKAFTFRNGEYLIDVEAEVIDRGRSEQVWLSLGPGISAQEMREGRSNYYYSSQTVWNYGGDVTRKKPGKLDDRGGIAGAVRWAGLEDQFFTALVLPGDSADGFRWTKIARTPFPEPGSDEAPDSTEIPIVAVGIGEGAQLFVGPKQYRMLKALGHELEKSVWFSSTGWLAVIVKWIYLGLLYIHDNLTNNYGLAIVLATFVLRILLFPVNQYAMVNMKKSQLQMQRLQPKVKGIKNKYKKAKDAESRGKMNQEMMAMYKQEGVNPMGGVTGCLPLLAQFPILIGFYNMLTVAVELRGAPFFGWIQDLSVKDPYWITPLLMGATMFLQQKLSMTKVTDPQQLQQQRIMMFMPFMFTFICLQMPAGLVLYWFVNNALGIGQQWLVNRHTSKLQLDVPSKPESKSKGQRKSKSGRQGA